MALSKTKKKKLLSYLLGIVLLAFGLQFVRYNLFATISRKAIIPLTSGIRSSINVQNGHEISQKFNAPISFQKITILVNSTEYKGNFMIGLKNAENDQSIFSYLLSPADLIPDKEGKKKLNIYCTDNNNKRIMIPQGMYELVIKNEKGSMDLSLCLSEGNDKVPAIAGKDALNISLELPTKIGCYLAIFILLVLSGYFICVFYSAYQHRLTIEKFYILSFIPLSIIYLILFLPWNTPDALSHFYAIYRFANLSEGAKYSEVWTGRTDDVKFLKNIFQIGGMNPSLTGYRAIAGALGLACENEVKIPLPQILDYMNFYSAFNYLPFILGILLGRIIHLNIVLSIYLGRTFACVIYGYLGYHAIQRTPVGKSVFALIMLLPMSLMNTSALSYDGMVMVSVLNFIACIFRMTYNQDENMVFYESMVWAFIVGAAKGGGYLLVLPLVALILKKPVTEKEILKFCCIISAGVISVILWDVIVQNHNQMFFQMGQEGGKNLSVSMAFKNPLKYLNMLLSDYLRESDFLLGTMFGTALGWLETVIPGTLVLLMAVMIGWISVMEIDLMTITEKEIRVFGTVLILGAVFIPVMLLSYTPVDSRYIVGIQGRYYLPILPIAYLMATKHELKRKIEIKFSEKDHNCYEVRVQKVLVLFAFVSCMAVYYMLHLYLSR